jgi:membrane protein DedA with SNARE-associated domain
MEFLREAASFVEPYVSLYGVVALFVIIYLESLGAPLPGESALIASSVMAASGEDFSIVQMFMAVWAAAVLGDCTGYAIGRIGGRPLLQRYGWVIRLTPERLSDLEELFRKRGAIIVVGARFVVLLRQLNGLIAGSVAMPWRSFLTANVLGAALWSAVWCFGPYYLGEAFNLHGILQKL